MKNFVMAAFALVAGLTGAAAQAAVYTFDLSGPQYGASDLIFRLPSSPDPADVHIEASDFYIAPVEIRHGSDTFFEFVAFNLGSAGGGLDIFVPGASVIGADGPQLFDGPLDGPTFKLGTFALSDGQSITISVPEPASWGLMVVGFVFVGAALRTSSLGALPFARSVPRTPQPA